MAADSADYLITAVRYNPAQTHIDAVQARPHDGSSIGAPSQMSRNEVLATLDWGYTLITAHLRDGIWRRGAIVRKVEIDGQPWLRTDTDPIEADNLGELPTY